MVGEQKNKGTEHLRSNVSTAVEHSASKSFRALDPSDIAHLQRVYPEIVDELKGLFFVKILFKNLSLDSFTRLKTAGVDWRCVKNEERRLLSCLSSFIPLVSVRNSIFLVFLFFYFYFSFYFSFVD